MTDDRAPPPVDGGDEPAVAPTPVRPRWWHRLAEAVRARDASFVFYLAARLLSAAAGFFLVKVLIEVLTKAEYALWGTLAAVSSMIVPVATLSVPAAMMRMYFDHPAHERERQGRLINTTLALTVASAALVLVYAGVATVLGLHDRHMLLYLAVVTTSTAMLGFWQYLIRMRDDYVLFFVNQMAERGNLIVLMLIAASLWGADVATWPGGDRIQTTIGLYALGQWALIAVNLAVYVRRQVITTRHGWLARPEIVAMVRFSAPLTMTYFLGWTLNSSDIYLLYRLGTPSDTADYVFSLGIATLVGLVTSAALTDWPRFYYAHMRDGGEGRDLLITRRAQLFLWLHAGSIVLTQLVGRLAYDLYGADEYVAGLEYLGYLLVGNFFFLAGNLFSAGIGYAKKTHLTVVAFALPGALNFGLNLWLIPLWGARAAAITTAIAFAVFACTCWWLGVRYYRFIELPRLLLPAAVATVAGVAPAVLPVLDWLR